MAITISELVLGAIIVVLLVRATQWDRRAGAAKDGGRADLKVIEDIQLGLSRLEERVEALETLLLDRQNKGDKR